jgi:hypothetical protein
MIIIFLIYSTAIIWVAYPIFSHTHYNISLNPDKNHSINPIGPANHMKIMITSLSNRSNSYKIYKDPLNSIENPSIDSLYLLKESSSRGVALPCFQAGPTLGHDGTIFVQKFRWSSEPWKMMENSHPSVENDGTF